MPKFNDQGPHFIQCCQIEPLTGSRKFPTLKLSLLCFSEFHLLWLLMYKPRTSFCAPLNGHLLQETSQCPQPEGRSLLCGSGHFPLCMGVIYTWKLSLVLDSNAYLAAGSHFPTLGQGLGQPQFCPIIYPQELYISANINDLSVPPRATLTH